MESSKICLNCGKSVRNLYEIFCDECLKRKKEIKSDSNLKSDLKYDLRK